MLIESRASDTSPALILRPWCADDLDALLAAYRDPVLRRWTRVPVTNAAEGRRWLDRTRQDWTDGRRYSLAVLEGATDDPRLVANVVLKGAAPERPAAEVGYWTAVWARGRGIAPRAVTALSRWAFDRFPRLERLDLLHQVDNVASCRVAQKSGYVFQEVLPARPPFPLDGHRHTLTVR
ncbi:GNAT family N-acetyltransferase [Micromonospora sp. STR1_7]|uniref:GNAT family N-acetyltransferase n=1 Tax=Micromonospora parastrephiae TaxID=2806101 RepID=A0ABS1XP46_9ACTN|nr:GNAT family N-acetyltransferase [Micromonospora parastrephiae]MBM0231027.1 GNAT family N-acetyltransferase [Micromonospora parastrephiae]